MLKKRTPLVLLSGIVLEQMLRAEMVKSRRPQAIGQTKAKGTCDRAPYHFRSPSLLTMERYRLTSLPLR
jgi:hypothetical protein